MFPSKEKTWVKIWTYRTTSFLRLIKAIYGTIAGIILTNVLTRETSRDKKLVKTGEKEQKTKRGDEKRHNQLGRGSDKKEKQPGRGSDMIEDQPGRGQSQEAGVIRERSLKEQGRPGEEMSGEAEVTEEENEIKEKTPKRVSDKRKHSLREEVI
jgi:hypothetical protein